MPEVWQIIFSLSHGEFFKEIRLVAIPFAFILPRFHVKIVDVLSFLVLRINTTAYFVFTSLTPSISLIDSKQTSCVRVWYIFFG